MAPGHSKEVARLSEQDAAAIRAPTDAHLQAVLDHDPEAFLATCTDDIHFFPPDQPKVSGQDACLDYMKAFPTPTTFTAEVQDVEGQGDMAYSRGTSKGSPFSGGLPIHAQCCLPTDFTSGEAYEKHGGATHFISVSILPLAR